MADFTADPNAINQVLQPMVNDWLQNKILTPIASEAFANCPVGTPDPLGRPATDPPMRYQINTRIEGSLPNMRGVVICNSAHALIVHNGTVPHLIEARNVSRLRFLQNGTVRFPRAVNHPGTQAQPFLRNALESVIGST